MPGIGKGYKSYDELHHFTSVCKLQWNAHSVDKVDDSSTISSE